MSTSPERTRTGAGLRGPVVGFVLLTLAPALLLAWLGWRGVTPLLDEVERSALTSVRQTHGSATAQVPARIEQQLEGLRARLAQVALRARDLLPTAASPGAALAALEREAAVPLVVRNRARRILPAGPTSLELDYLQEWPAFTAYRAAFDRGAVPVVPPFVSGPLCALALAYAGSDAALQQLATMPLEDLVAAGPLPLERLAAHRLGQRVLAGLQRRGLLVAVPATERARLRWLQAAGVDEQDLAAQRLRAAEERGEARAVEVVMPSSGGVLAGIVDVDALCAAAGFVRDGCAVTVQPARGLLDVDMRPEIAVEVVQTALGPLQVRTEHLDLQRLRDGAERQRWISAAGIALLVVAMSAGVLLVRRALVRERRARQLRDEFIASVSHELKTPLTAMRMHTEMLTDRRIDAAERTRYGAIAVSEGARLSALVDDLLDFAALERGRRRLEPEPVDLAAVGAAAVETWRGFAVQHGVELRHEADGEALALVDPIAVTRIVNNLLQNAFRHGAPARDASVRRVVVRSGPGPRLFVCNNGPVIPQADRERIFARFERLRDGPGMGLGLAMSRELSRACGGDLRCSDDGGMTTFALALPAVPELESRDLAVDREVHR